LRWPNTIERFTDESFNAVGDSSWDMARHTATFETYTNPDAYMRFYHPV
jgi:hypothetical protein